ncbi:SDR family oxidoreductase [Shewanella sp. D64]|uniref:dTDP-4-dehydrorhamnose reductase family protein n=1 Tax=unclassified Shewanella TaxID=196818 RepID=UPI0022BA6335|nr:MULTISPECIES: SDR family oxidoreductase [unclassified Shewanella]MEC4726099.1 SDR family oxidoreductase [Shewanella sp. D64]MEC4737985.1 SDR family oxidoreductase [Shewanella sp. E94]WBJ96184.1 SDR family oxidoreductase [Shewanella sp. MTB7]
MAKIMITGATGLLGRAVVKQLALSGEHELIATGFSRAQAGIYKLDLTDNNAIEQFIVSQQPDVIVHCAAERRPDVSEQFPEAALALNLGATAALAKAAKQQGAWLIYISTDYVFDGTKPSYIESDAPNPVNFYGESKLRGEQLLLETSADFAVLRLPILYGQVEQVEESAVLVLLNQLLDKQSQNVDHWAIRSPTSTQDVAIAIEKMIALKLDNETLKGVYHFSAKEVMSKYQMLLVLGELLELDTQHLSPVSEPTDSAKRPHDCTLSCQRLESIGIVSQVSFMQGSHDSLISSPKALSLIGIELS